MQKFLKKYNVIKIAKIAGLGLLGLVVVSAALQFIGGTFETVYDGALSKQSANRAYDYEYADESYGESALRYENSRSISSAPAGGNGDIIAPQPDIVEGDDAEDFEVTEYTARIESNNAESDCTAITSWKPLEYVIFESASSYDGGCNYRLKVRKENAEEVLNKLREFDPEDISENTYTIKNIVDNYNNQTDILEAKKVSIEATLKEAIEAYDEITEYAKNAQSAESLATIIDGKVRMIEKLTQERINIDSQLQRYEQSRVQQLDRLNYVYFNINVFENKIFDGEDLIDSWKSSAKQFVRDMNSIAQDVTINLLLAVFIILQYALYGLIAVYVAKYGWKMAKYIWNK